MSDFAINALILSAGLSVPVVLALLGMWANRSLEKEQQASAAKAQAKQC